MPFADTASTGLAIDDVREWGVTPITGYPANSPMTRGPDCFRYLMYISAIRRQRKINKCVLCRYGGRLQTA